MLAKSIFPLVVCIALWLVPGAVSAASPKIDKDTCEQLKTEQEKFVQSGIMSDIEKGAQWGKTNLSPERLREVQHFIMLDEQLKFGCRIVTLTDDAKKAVEAAKRIELNPNADPTKPPEPAQETAAKPPLARPSAEPARKAGDAKPPAPAKPVKKSTKPSPATPGREGRAVPAKNTAWSVTEAVAHPVASPGISPGAVAAPLEEAPGSQVPDAYQPPRMPASSFRPPAFVE